MQPIYSLILGKINWRRWSFRFCFVFFEQQRGKRIFLCVLYECFTCVRACFCMRECEMQHRKCGLVKFLIVLTQALKISLHSEAPWFSRIQNACNTEKLTANPAYSWTTLLHPRVLMYSSERVGHCTEMWHQPIRKYFCSHVGCLSLIWFLLSMSISL